MISEKVLKAGEVGGEGRGGGVVQCSVDQSCNPEHVEFHKAYSC